MNNTPLVSVIIPTYNRANLIKRSVDSVLNQTYKNFEIIIIDDGSTDNTEKIISSINDPRIVYLKQENHGASTARNKGIEIAKGEFIAFQDSDDVWHFDKLEKQVIALQNNNADVVFCKMFAFGNLRKRIVSNNFKQGFLGKKTLPLGISTQSLLGRRNIFINFYFDSNTEPIEDFELLLRINQNFSIYCIDEPLVDYYSQDNSISNKSYTKFKSFELILNKHKEILKNADSLYAFTKLLFTTAFEIKDKKLRKKAYSLINEINKSKQIKIIYIFHMLRIYKMRKLAYNFISIPTKKLITLYKKYTSGLK